MFKIFELGGIIVPVHAGGDIEVTFEDVGGFTWPPLRMMNGTAVVQENWRKLRVSVSGSGILPAGLASLDYTAPHTLKSPTTRSVQAATNVVPVPAARRIDTGYTPRGYAVVGGNFVSTPLSMAGNNATLTSVSGASGYGVLYYPQLTVFAALTTSGSSASAQHGWQITAEEV
ncbi:MAG TPA: hypothetical protein PKC22_09570 [Rhodocyclaceae bacterium]|nr:hypothetical protein [Rhodocyclaceae bacterium]